MSSQTKKRVISDVVVKEDALFHRTPGKLVNNSLVELTAALQATNATMQDIVGYPLIAEATAGEYELMESGDEANCDAILLMDPRRSSLFDPQDATASLAASGGTTAKDYVIIDRFQGLVLRENWMPADDLWDTAFTKATLRTAVEALGARILPDSVKTESL